MTETEELVERNRTYATTFVPHHLPPRPFGQLAVVTCMDARLDIFGALGLDLGEAHVIRNAGGIVTEDVLRSVLLSQRLLGTTSIAVVQHTDCGMATFRDADLADAIAAEVGIRPPFRLGAFDDPIEEVQRSIRLLAESPFLLHRDTISGFVMHVETGRLDPVGLGPSGRTESP